MLLLAESRDSGISFSDGLAFAAIVLTIVLLVLDKAGKLKGPILFWLLALAALMTMPLVFGNAWVAGAPNRTVRAFRVVFLLCSAGAGYAALSAWIAIGPEFGPESASSSVTSAGVGRAAPQSEGDHPIPIAPPIAGEGPANRAILPKPARAPTAEEIAAAVAEKTRIRDSFSREMDRPINSMYVILYLSRHLTPDAVIGIAGAIEIFDAPDEHKPGLFFGFRPGTQDWTEIPGNRKTILKGIRSEVWTFPRTSDANTKASILDNFLACRFDYLDRLEAGAASMKLPFQTVGGLDRAAILFKGSRQLIDLFSSIRIVVNDFVILEIDRKDIVNWSAPPPPMTGRVIRGEIDPNTGQIKSQEIVKETPLILNNEMPDGFRDFSYFTALFVPDRAQKPAPLNNTVAVNLAEAKIEIHRVTNGRLPSQDGSMWILPGQHGWLPR